MECKRRNCLPTEVFRASANFPTLELFTPPTSSCVLILIRFIKIIYYLSVYNILRNDVVLLERLPKFTPHFSGKWGTDIPDKVKHWWNK